MSEKMKGNVQQETVHNTARCGTFQKHARDTVSPLDGMSRQGSVVVKLASLLTYLVCVLGEWEDIRSR